MAAEKLARVKGVKRVVNSTLACICPYIKP